MSRLPGVGRPRQAARPASLAAALAVLAAMLAVLLATLVAGCSAGSPAVASLQPAVLGAGGRLPGATSCPAPSPSAPGAAESGLPVRSLCALPPEADQVWRTISGAGRPAYPKDGSIFGNAERRLPRHEGGYYREYTVPTPGSRDRGARRLVTGERRELYYTGDHYGSFVVVDPTTVG